MNTNMVTSLANGMSWGERFSQAGIVTLQGMLTIFTVLSLLWLAIEVMHWILHGKDKAKTKTETKSEPSSVTPTPNAEDAAKAAAIAAAIAASEDDGALVAAITAAVSQAMAEDGYTGSFRVVSFKRVGKAARRR